MADYLSLEEAAKKLGIPTERLVELRSQGKVRGFRDGASWKFPENSIEQLKDDLGDALSGGSGILVDDLGSSISSGSSIIGGDNSPSDDGGSDLEIGGESVTGDSDVNLIASEGDGSDVAIIASDSDLMMESAGSGLLEIDSADLQLEGSAIMHDSAQLDLAIEPNAGSTGPVTDAELKEIAESHPDVLAPEGPSSSNLSFDDSDDDMLGSSLDSAPSGVSSLELMDDLKLSGDSGANALGSRGVDVLSELDLLSAEQSGSGLISGDSENLLMSSGLGSSIGADGMSDSDVSGLDDALDDDDDLVIADDDDDLVISNAGSDISVAGDSGINLMSPSDSGLSLESEPLDLAGSSISALDLGAELSEGGSSGSGGGSGSMVDFQADEEFQLSPSGIGLDADMESGSQVIEVEDSGDVAEAVEFDDAGFGDADPMGGDVFGDAPVEEGFAMDDDGEAVEIDESSPVAMGPVSMGGYEVPFTMLQCVTLMLVLMVLSLGGMLMTDLVRNMWTYTETSAPVSSLTDSLVGLMGWGQ
ncbi:Helix-turn-helix domain protein [Rubripirellula tenax]|uniref:Helix-turn-helix domain protein n=1 Tax=Rubripirellula tenax TaxID=2528015 RepID=A0A5C6FI88_9BACT|nr:helix-turn-helix domain-containing protein [Rubripirellula tenax]TWU59349.1 Helix-turn-helix domain protein [Rubripirellula tenax]